MTVTPDQVRYFLAGMKYLATKTANTYDDRAIDLATLALANEALMNVVVTKVNQILGGLFSSDALPPELEGYASEIVDVSEAMKAA